MILSGKEIKNSSIQIAIPMLEGRSSIARLGLFVHITPGFGYVGFKGYWTLEIFSIHNYQFVFRY